MAIDSISLEFYPKLSNEELLKSAKTIIENKNNWDAPFFMDIYAHADIKEFKRVCKPFLEDKNLNNLIIIGTGGSYQTMKGLELFSKKKIHFITSSRPYELSRVLKKTSPDDSLVIPISRGGKTLDVNSVLPLFKEYKMLALSSRGPMKKMVEKLGATILPVPDLSGRFAASVCSVGLIPIILAEIDLSSFQKGMEDGYSQFTHFEYINLDNHKFKQNEENNLCLAYATFLHKLYLNGYRNIFSMPYSIWLEGMVGLFVQEISESSGKDGKGFLGTSQEAPLCQHSVLELLLGGSKGHSSPLLWNTNEDLDDLSLKSLGTLNFDLEGLSALDVINYQLDATLQALVEQNIPSAKLTMAKNDPYHFGKLIAFIQTTVYYYCMISNVNWSSNPLVNTGKEICNNAIEKKISLEERSSARAKIAEKKFSTL